MRFSVNNLATVITSALLVSSATAELTKVPRRSANDAIIARAEDDCAAELEARGLTGGLLHIRDDLTVGMGRADGAKKDDKIKMDSISICTGAGATGSFADEEANKDEHNKFGTHLAAGYWKNTWGDFKNRIQAAKDKGWTAKKAKLALIDLSTVGDDFEAWDEARVGRQQAYYDTLEKEFGDLVGITIDKEYHHVTHEAKVEVDDDDVKIEED